MSAEEIAATSAILTRQQYVSETVRFVSIELHEPAKPAVLGLTEDQNLDRETFAVLRDQNKRVTIEAIVSLTRGEVLSWREIPGVQPAFTRDEFEKCEALVLADPRFQQAMLRRGVTDLSLVLMDSWAAGNTGPQDDPAEGRLIRLLIFVRHGTYDNRYARPVGDTYHNTNRSVLVAAPEITLRPVGTRQLMAGGSR